MNLLDLLSIEANRKLHNRYDFRGLKVSIENRKGSIRQGIDKNGKKWKVKMTFDYGYIRGTRGVDDDAVDCFIGPDKDAEKVYVVHRVDPDTKEYDEDKCMVGFKDAAAAKSAFLANYDRPGNFGSMDEMSFEDFKTKVLATKDKPVKLAAGGPGSGRHPLENKNWKIPNMYRSRVKKGEMVVFNIKTNKIIPGESKKLLSKENLEKIERGMKNGSKFPMIIVHVPENGKNFKIEEGHHRFFAWRDTMKKNSIPALGYNLNYTGNDLKNLVTKAGVK